MAYQSAAGYSAVIRPTNEMGSVRVPSNYREALKGPHAEYWKRAIQEELSGLMQRDTWHSMRECDLPPGANLMNCHFVFDLKRTSSGSIEKWKARLVADGNTQRDGVDFDRIFSTVVKLQTLRMLLVVAVAKGYTLSSADVRQAFLQGTIKEDLYMRMPPSLPRLDEKGNRLIVKLKRSLYGLKQAARIWNEVLVKFLTTWGFIQSTIDTCMFAYKGEGGNLIVAIWVDDAVIAASYHKLRERFVKDLNARFPVDDRGDLEWVLGVQVTYDQRSRSLKLSQELYINDLVQRHAPHLPKHGRRYDTPMSELETLSRSQCPAEGSPEKNDMSSKKEEYMTVIGALLWLAAFTRPDVTYAASVLARFVANPALVHYMAMQRVLSYLASTADHVMIYRPRTESGLIAYTDANWSEQFSTAGMVALLYGCPIAWYSRLQRSVSHSSAEAEFQAASMAAREVTFLREILTDLQGSYQTPTPLYIDNKSAIDMTFDPVAFKKTKHILRDAYYLRDLVARGVFGPKHVGSTDQLGDTFTKPLGRALFQSSRAQLVRCE